jgi:hypothetical protein
MIPDEVDGFRSEEINSIIKCLRALWPMKSSSLLITVTSQGTSQEVKQTPAVTTGAFSGTAYIAGNKTTGLGTKAWVRCFLDTGTAEDNDGPPPNPFPINEEWYEVAQTFGNINIPRA